MSFAARRGRGLALSGLLLAGGIGVISATQTWLTATRSDGGTAIAVPGADVLPLLTPLSLAVLALAAALAMVGPVLRIVFSALALLAGGFLAWSTAELLLDVPRDAVSGAVTEATGLAGDDALADIIAAIDVSVWPWVALVAWALLVVTALFALVTGPRWKSGGRRYRTDIAARPATDGPVDAVDSWDDLSRGTDPTR